MKSIRVASLCLLAFVLTLALAGCQHTASKAVRSNEGSVRQAQSASQLTNAQAQPASTTAQSSSNSDQAAASSGPAPSPPSAAPTPVATPAPSGQGAQATQVDQSS